MASVDERLHGSSSSEGPVLTAKEKKILEVYLKYRDRPPTFFFLVSRYFPFWTLGIIALSAVVALLASLNQSIALVVGSGVVGFMIALIGRDIRYTWQITHNLPLILRVLDWKKVDRLYSQAGSMP